MTITLYCNSSPPNTISKSLVRLSYYEGTLRATSSVIDPIIQLQGVYLPSANYMYIPNFNRYYYIKNVLVTNEDLWTISAHVDVLMSYANAIRNSQAIVARNENKYNLYLDDGIFKAYQNPKIKRITWPQNGGLGQFNYSFTIGGNGDYVPPESPGSTPTPNNS